jgi:TPR repeat protein
LAHDAFISYSSEDKAAADAACATLETAGIRCWIAPRDISPGAEWGAAIVDAIDHSAVMVLIFSTNANESRQIRREVEHAVSMGVTVVPVRIDQAEPMRSLAYFMAGVHWLDALTPPLENHLQGLAVSIKAFLSAAPANPSTKLGQVQLNPASASILEGPAVTGPGAIPGRADDEREKKEQPRGRRTARRRPSAITPEPISGRGAEEEQQRWQEQETEQLRQHEQAASPQAQKELEPEQEKKERPRGRRTPLRQPPTITPEPLSGESAEEEEQEGEQRRRREHATALETQKEADSEREKKERPQGYRTSLRRPAAVISALTAVLLVVVMAWVLVPRQETTPPIASPVTPSPAPKISAAEALQKGDDADHRKDYAEALRWYLNAADQGNAQAAGNLGQLYFFGQGVSVDYGQAMRWSQKAADQDNPRGQTIIGLLYEYGRGVTQDYGEAMRWLQKAADQGYAPAQVDIGVMYEYGRGVRQDYGEAMRWYREAADHGYAPAQTNLGSYYEQGRGGLTKDDHEAARLYKLAADQGNAQAQTSLGLFYEQGRGGLTKDDREAARLFKLAADQGKRMGAGQPRALLLAGVWWPAQGRTRGLAASLARPTPITAQDHAKTAKPSKSCGSNLG